jgi:pantetheine-phosphate adenylyltransferase
MVKAIYPGTFDPPTLGHTNLIARAALLCGNQLTVAIGINPLKKTVFSVEERIDMLEKSFYCSAPGLISVSSYQGLLINYAQSLEIKYLIRGIRNAADFEYESQLAQINKKIAPEIETIFLLTKPELSIVSSSAVKEIARYGGDISSFVSPYVATKIREKLGFVPSAEEAAKVKTGFIKYGTPEK